MLLPATPDKPRGIPPAVHRPPQEAVDLYSAGVFMWERRTPESLNRAVRYFNQAIARDPEYAEAYVGLANCYLLLREFTRMPASEAYPRAAEAARRALALNDRLSSAHAALAFVTFYWSQDFANGERSFRQAVALDPRSARARHWYATALMHKGEMSRALTQINQAQRLDPESHAILADKALIMFFAGQSDEAVKLLDQIVAVEPDFLSPHAYLAIINLAEGQYRPYLREARRAAALLGDKQRLAVIDAAHKGFDEGGVEGMLTARVKAEERFYAAGSELDYNLAATNALLGNEDAALTHLRRSVAKKEPPTLGLRVDPSFRVLRSNPKFVRLADGIGTPS